MAVQIIAHRGASHDAPENTLAAVNLAWRQEADAVEIDIQLSRDGHLVVYHDKDTLRTTGGAGNISELTLAQIQALDAGAWKGREWQGEKIPTLDEVLEHLPARNQLVIELKGDASLVAPLEAVLNRWASACEQVVLIGFDGEAIREAKRHLPHVTSLLLFGFEKDDGERRWNPRIEELIRRAKEVGADGLDLCYSHPDDLQWVGAVKAAGLRALVWTVDDASAARHLVKAGIEGITTNRPGWLREQLFAESGKE